MKIDTNNLLERNLINLFTNISLRNCTDISQAINITN